MRRAKRYLTVGVAWLIAIAFHVQTDALASAPSVSQVVGVAGQIVDEFGEPLLGTGPTAYEYGLEVVEGDVVQVLLALDNAIYPPNADGTPHPNNVVLSTIRIGWGVSPLHAQPARFSASLTPRPGGSSRIFVRAFNAPTVDDASFYGDSETFTVRSWLNQAFIAHIAATIIPLDPADDDGDGLNNSWEQSYGSDPNAVDTDGDGLSDGQEVVAGTDLLDADSLLMIVEAEVIDDGYALLKWSSVEGKRYQVEYTTDILDENPKYVGIDTVTADSVDSEFYVPDGFLDVQRYYRVRVID